MYDIVIVGSSNTDMVLRVPEIPRPGETIAGDGFNITGGGKGANQAVAAARARIEEQSVFFVACVGDDELGEQAIRGFKEVGINTEYISVESDVASGVALIFVADSGENTIGINPGANARLSLEHIHRARSVLESSELLLTQLEIPLPTLLEAIKLAKAAGIQTILNPAPARELPEEIFALLDYFTPNQTETEIYTGIFPDSEETAKAAAQNLMDRGVKNVIITMGSKGAFYMNAEYSEFEPSLEVEAVDTVAAGDTFNGALAIALARKETLQEALRFATVAAGIAVTRVGAQASAPSIAEIRQKL